MRTPSTISPEIAAILKSYVYVYTDPRDHKPFYIGKGQGSRAFSHLNDVSDTDKTATIAAIRESGQEPEIDILRYGLSDAEASLVEASAIDLMGVGNLTNRAAGGHSAIVCGQDGQQHQHPYLLSICRLLPFSSAPCSSAFSSCSSSRLPFGYLRWFVFLLPGIIREEDGLLTT